jgi:rhamnose utilization protein RhaD (predicted bifunctional aldolase and dehydrogenase)/NAD(P)-dependent dehydrogenase (short-subunit alcohol dehydrogenase family)|tara:strand:+ start:2658 stop:4634 length:1977 start_codon:yes stop_codon:yes gene_type:complete
MENRWDESKALQFASSDLQQRVYTSRLLGEDRDLVLYGGGNTSLKSFEDDLFGQRQEILNVKGSGQDLNGIDAAGFAPVRLGQLKQLLDLTELSDAALTRCLRTALIDPDAPSPSVEALLHALIPSKFVDHTHADVVVTISNTAEGESSLREVYGAGVLILPYVMSGFVLAKQVFEATRDVNWQELDGIVLMHHGLFTFGDDARTSYDKMIELVSKAEQYLGKNVPRAPASREYQPVSRDYLDIARVRHSASQLAGSPLLVRWNRSVDSAGYASLDDIESVAVRGPITPDHVLHTKRVPAILDDDPVSGVEQFGKDYLTYFDTYAEEGSACLDPAPRYGVWKGKGCLSLAVSRKRLPIVHEIVDHTMRAVQWGDLLGGWQPVTEEEIFRLEYWQLEQAKLQQDAAPELFEGKVVLVTGAASGIGQACAREFISAGAAVIALDINAAIEEQFTGDDGLGIICDLTSSESIVAAVRRGVEYFGGIDLLVSNAGAFPASLTVAELSDDDLSKSMELNFSSHVKVMRECIPYLKLGFEPVIILMASKNVPAPGPGAGAYSAAKAALTQIARVAALELGGDGIRVNAVHPNAVFDTGVWTDEVLQKRADHYGLSVDEYKRNNILKTDIGSRDVAKLVVALSGPAFAKTTGAQIAVDGGNDRVI